MSANPKIQAAMPDPIRLDPVSDGSPELDFGFDGSLAEELDASASAISAPPAVSFDKQPASPAPAASK